MVIIVSFDNKYLFLSIQTLKGYVISIEYLDIITHSDSYHSISRLNK